MISDIRTPGNDLLPADPVGQRLCELFGQYRWSFIEADLPDDTTAKPDWHTQTKYPIRPRVLWTRWQDANSLIGVRFDSQTYYALIDLDIISLYCSAEGVATIRAALETIGIVRTILLRSSWSNGLHLYIPLPEAVSTFDLAVALVQCLKAQGIGIAKGQVETFPNVKTYGSTLFTEYNGHRLPLQPASGSCLLDDDLSPLPGDLSRFLWQWDQLTPHQDMAALNAALKLGRDNHRKRPKRKTRPVESWRLDLETEINDGWSGPGQTNHLLKTIACYGRVFEGLKGQALAEYVQRIAERCPGYETHCRHQPDIQRRSLAWANAAEHYYWPLGTQPTRDPRAADSNLPSVNQQRSEDAQSRIQAAIAQLKELNQLPEQITARAKAIAQAAQVSLQTLYKHLNLWHFSPSVIDPPEGISGDSSQPSLPPAESLNPSEIKELHTLEENMKCEALWADEAGSKKQRSDPDRGVRGDEVVYPQAAELEPLHFLDDFAQGCRRQLQRLGWSAAQLVQFIAERFNGKRRSELTDDELVSLLYQLQTLDALK